MPEFKGIIRVANKDLKGSLPLPRALVKIKGIGINLADSIAEIAAKELKINKEEKIGNLTSEQIEKLEDILLNPERYGVPLWMLNKRSDLFTGKNIHLIASDLDFRTKQDIEFEKTVKSYRGVRHMFGLPVRGQRTKTMGRTGLTLGVTKAKQKPTIVKEKGKGKKE